MTMFRGILLVLVIGMLGLAGLRVATVLGVSQPATPSYDQTGLPVGPVSYQQVSAHAEARLFYPGSAVFRHFGAAEYRHPMSGDIDAAFAGAVLANTTNPARIYLWYQLWLLKHGWHSVASGRLATWFSNESYARGARESFVVAMDNPQLLGKTLGKPLPLGRTIYEVSYSIAPSGKTSP